MLNELRGQLWIPGLVAVIYPQPKLFGSCVWLARKLDRDSIMRHGERLKTTARKLEKKLGAVLASHNRTKP